MCCRGPKADKLDCTALQYIHKTGLEEIPQLTSASLMTHCCFASLESSVVREASSAGLSESAEFRPEKAAKTRN